MLLCIQSRRFHNSFGITYNNIFPFDEIRDIFVIGILYDEKAPEHRLFE